MKRFLITVSALSLLAAPTASFAQDGRRGDPDRQARREQRQAERAGQSDAEREQRRAERQARGGDDDRADRQAQREAARQQQAAQAAAQANMSDLQRRDAAARAQAEENARRVAAGQPRIGERRVRPEDRAYRQGSEWRGDDRREARQDRREDRRDWREDRRDDRREWRQDQRRRWSYRGRSYEAFRVAPYRWAPGFRRFSFGIGTILPSPFLSQSQTYVIRDYWSYGLPRPPVGTYWLRVDTDVLLVDRRGRVVDVIRDVFYWDDGYGW